MLRYSTTRSSIAHAAGLLLLAAMMALLLAACGGSGASVPAAPSAVAVEDAATEVAAVAEAPTKQPVAEPTAEPTEEPAAEPAAEAAPEAAPTGEESADIPAAAEDELLIDASIDRGAISPLVYGANTGPGWVLMPVVSERAVALGLGVISYPGGEYGDSTNLTELQIDQFKAQSDTLGAVPLIHVRVPGGSPEQAAALVTYANLEKGYNIRYWAIGNEPNLYAPRHTSEPWAPQYFADKWREFAIAMKAADPTILLIGPEVTNFEGTGSDLAQGEQDNAEWVRVFLETNSDLVDIVSIHRYPFPMRGGSNPESATVEELRTNPRELDGRILPDLRALILETTGKELPIAITEFGLDSRNIIRGETAPNSPLAAVWWGDALMRVIDEGVEIVGYWNLSARDDQGGHGIFTNYDGRPVYHTFSLFSRFGDTLLYADAGNQDIKALAAQREDGALTVLVSNMSLSEEVLTVTLEGVEALETVEAWRVLGDVAGAEQIDEALTSGADVVLPPLSLTLFILQ